MVIGVFLIAYFFYKDKNTDWSRSCESSLDSVSKKQCWEELVENTLKVKGIESAFDLVDYLYKSDLEFASDCHAYIHIVGDRAYHFYSQDKQIKLSSKSSSCGYGFYHGFMETLLIAGEDIKGAGQFCKWAAKLVGGKNDVEGACFHGIGHGLSDNHDKIYWSNENELVDNPLLVCEAVGPDEYMVNRCASGVFNVLAINYIAGFLPLREEDPLGFCKRQTKSYFKKPCFEEMNTMLISISNKDLLTAAEFLEEIEDEYAISAMRSLAGVVGMSHKDLTFSKQIDDCRKVQDRLHLPCIRGFVSGLIEAETSEQEVKALSFCESSTLSDEESGNCYQEALRLLSLYLPQDRYQSVCRNLNERYQILCST